MTETKRRGWHLFLIMLAVISLAALLRGWAVLRLPEDFDEPVYLQAGYDYSRALRAGDWDALIDYPENREHPPLIKLLYGLTMVSMDDQSEWRIAQLASRLVSAFFGVLTVLFLALFDPLAGGLLAVHSLTIKYSAQVYLEALPMMASLIAVLAFHRSQSSRDRWFWLSGAAIGVTAAGKYVYLFVCLVILYMAIWEKRTSWRDLIFYGLTAVVVFWALNPSLWYDPFERMWESLTFHWGYSRGAHVEAVGYPWYQPLYWITRSPPAVWHPDIFFYFTIDGLITALALPGLYWEWRERRWVVVWIVAGLVVLLLWSTKWPQYTLLLTPALCLSASSALKHLFQWLQDQESYWGWVRQMLPSPPMSFWIISAALVLVLVVGYSVTTIDITLGSLGWSNMNSETSFLPSDAVYAVEAGPDGEMILGTGRGAAIWMPAESTDVPDRWLVYNHSNAELADEMVRAVAYDFDGSLWFGTPGGLSRFDGEQWVTFRGDELGLVDHQIYALAVGGDGDLWVGAKGGAALYSDGVWESFDTKNSGLSNDWVLSIEIDPRPEGDVVWFGTRTGVSRLDTASGDWETFGEPFEEEWGGVTDLLFDGYGRLWAGTRGGGLGVMEAGNWQFYRTSSSDIPYNTVNAIAERSPGVLWVGFSYPTEAGGVIAQYDGDDWEVFDAQNSGFSGAEPLAIAVDGANRWWFGTRSAGIDLFTRGDE